MELSFRCISTSPVPNNLTVHVRTEQQPDTWVFLGFSTCLYGEWSQFQMDLSSVTTQLVQLRFRAVFPAFITDGSQLLRISDICLRPHMIGPPPCPTSFVPPSSIASATLHWSLDPNLVEGVLLFLGTDGSSLVVPTNMVNGADVSTSTSVTLNSTQYFQADVDYYMKLIPYSWWAGNNSNCPILKFRVPFQDAYCTAFAGTQLLPGWYDDSPAHMMVIESPTDFCDSPLDHSPLDNTQADATTSSYLLSYNRVSSIALLPNTRSVVSLPLNLSIELMVLPTLSLWLIQPAIMPQALLQVLSSSLSLLPLYHFPHVLIPWLGGAL